MENQIENRDQEALRQLGYLKESPAVETHAVAGPNGNGHELGSALKSFQIAYGRSYGLEPTGTLDRRTRKVLRQPRCGCSDPQTEPALEARPAEAVALRGGTLRYFFKNSTDDLTNPDEAKAQVRLAFATWQSLDKVKFQEVLDERDADVVVSWVEAAGDLLGDAIARADFPGARARRQHLKFDEDEALWVIGEALNGFDIQTVALHEIGHLLGLDHVEDPDAVMHFSFRANRTNRHLTAADLAAFTKLFP